MDDQITHFLYLDSSLPPSMSTVHQRMIYEVCAKRVRAYKKIDLASISLQAEEEAVDYQKFVVDSIGKILRENDLLLFSREQYEQQKFNDKLSRFFLEIVYSRNEELIRQFVKHEEWILKSRLLQFSKIENNALEILQAMGVRCKKITPSDWNNFGKEIKISSKWNTADDINQYYKIPFQYVLKGLERMKVFLNKGIAYVHKTVLLEAVIENYCQKIQLKLTKLNQVSHLNKDMQSKQYHSLFENDERLEKLATLLPDVDMSSDADYIKHMSQQGGQYVLTIQNMDQVAKQSFPMCMKYLYDKLIELHHLKHFGRLQLQLFMKGAGLKINDAQYFWKFQFTKVMSASDFDKEHAYNIRYNYGLEGKKMDFGSFSCQSIMMNRQPGAAKEYHGCPFKHFNNEGLKAYLILQGIPKSLLDEVMALKTNHHYQVGCKKTFDALHPDQSKRPADLIIDNPLRYYNSSRQYHEGTSKMQEEKGQTVNAYGRRK